MNTRTSLRQTALIIALFGALFGVYQWVGSGLGIISALTPTRLLPYVTWASIPTVITILFSITTRRVAVSSGMTNIFLVTALLFYYVSYAVDLLFFNTNELLVDLHYETLQWTSFSAFIRGSILSELVEKLILALPLALALAGLSVIIIRICAFMERQRHLRPAT